jgi:hypothetical protein
MGDSVLMGENSDEATLWDLIYDYLLGMDGIWMEYDMG